LGGILLGIPDGGSWRAASTSAAVVRKKYNHTCPTVFRLIF